MDVRADNRGRPHQKVHFSAAPVMGRNFLTPGHPGVRARNVRGKSGPKKFMFMLFFLPWFCLLQVVLNMASDRLGVRQVYMDLNRVLSVDERSSRSDLQILRQRPGLVQLVLTVLAFWSWVMLVPRLLASFKGLRLCPWTSMFALWPLGHRLGSAAHTSHTYWEIGKWVL